MSVRVLPELFVNKWQTGNFKTNNKFTEHDNYNIIQNYGEYFDEAYGKRFFPDKAHISNPIFKSNKPFTKREQIDKSKVDPGTYSNYHHRFSKRNYVKINSAPEGHRKDLELYTKQKEKVTAPNSLTFETELFVPYKQTSLIATQPFRKHFIHPWKYSYKTINYQTCTEQFRRVKSSCIDLSKY